ncbi:hypothetical protein [Delftia deserti]|uniref:Uncharacterized protein n=1 Tax=Delftia deserti TaxID=1651218 RepID=A0ABW5ESG3_9BURK
MTTAPTPSDVERLARGLEEGFCGYAAWLQPAAAELRRLQADNEAMRETLEFVERWAVHHASKPHMTAELALGSIQHHPEIRAITERYADSKRPDTFDPYARIAELEAQLVAEARATAEHKLRADQLAQQHRMQAQMHAQATQQLAELEARKPLPLSYRVGAMTSSVDGAATVSLHFNDMAEAEAWFVAITDQYDAGLVDKSPNLQGTLVDKTANLQDRPVSLIASREVVADGPVHVTRLHLTEEGRAALTSKAAGPLPGITGGSS